MKAALALLLLLLLHNAWLGTAQNVSTYEFLSRPDIVAPRLQVHHIDRSTVGDGYLFVAPKTPSREFNFTIAMYIYDTPGNLVWSGHKYTSASHDITNFHRCEYRDAPHLCTIMYDAPFQGRPSHGSYSLIMDSSYRPVRAIAPGALYYTSTLAQDMHEFTLTENGTTALLSSYATIQLPTTLHNCSGTPTIEFLKTGFFTETATDGTNETLFQWNALDHVNISDTYVCPGDHKAGSGRFVTDGFDFFHINSIDKDVDGDYLVSARHTSTIYKIAGLHSPSGQKPGSIIWQLGGKRNEFRMESLVPHSGTFNFSYQHDARFRPGGIHLWNNANNENGKASARTSSGLSIDLNYDVATLTYMATPPTDALAVSQGNHQVLPNGNHFCAMGSSPEVFERTAGGALALHASFGIAPMASYRSFKAPWHGHPAATELSLFAFAQRCSARPTFYMSWNGATEVREYHVFTSNSSTGPFSPAATVKVDGRFEHMAHGAEFAAYSYVLALGQDKLILGRSRTVRTFAPVPQFANQCNELRCPFGTNYELSQQDQCIIEAVYNG